MKTRLQQQQHEQRLEQLRAQGAIALDIPQLWQQEGEPESSTESSSESSTESESSSTAATGGEDLTGLKNSLAAARRERDEALRQVSGLQGELTSTQQSLTNVQGSVETLQGERDRLTVDLALTNELKDVDPTKRDLLLTTARSQVGLVDGEVKAGDRPLAEYVTGLRSQYPDMFLAPNVPTGTGTTPSTPQTPAAATVVDAPGGIIAGVDPADIISGKVKITS